MSNSYTPTTNFGAKDSLSASDPNKVVRGSEFTTEFDAIASAFSASAPKASPTFTGTVTLDNLTATGSVTLPGVPSESVEIVAGTGLTGGGTLEATRTLNLDTSNNRNVDHSAVSVLAGTGLTGGGTINGDLTLNLDTANDRNVDHSSVSISAGTGLSGGGTIASSRTLSLDTNSNRNVDHSAVSTIAGNGLTGGGTHAATRTLNVVAGNGLVATANEVAMTGSYTGTFTATEIQATSDERLKTNIQPIVGAGAMIGALDGKHYEFLPMGGAVQYGVIAQQVQGVVPEAVGESLNGTLSVNYNQLVAVLIEAVKELQARVDTLEGADGGQV